MTARLTDEERKAAAARRQARYVAKRLAATPQRRCAYKRCNKLYTPGRTKSRYCSNSCANTVGSLKRNKCEDAFR